MRAYKSFFTFLLLLISFCCISQEYFKDSHLYKIKKVQDDIYFAYRPELLRHNVQGNCLIIINSDNVVVVDASGSSQGARQIISEIKKLTDKPVRFLINTHWHDDHIAGNSEYARAFPGINIIAHPETHNYLTVREGGINYVKSIAKSIESQLNYVNGEIERVANEAYPGHEKVIENLLQYRDHDLLDKQRNCQNMIIEPPNMTFEDTLILYFDKREIHLTHIGRGDTPGDVWVYLPKEKILCSGDAVVHPVPFGFSRQIEWLETLQKAGKIDFEILVPGHGDIQYDKDYVNLYIELLESVYNQIESGINAGLTEEQVVAKVDITNIEKKFTEDDVLRQYYFFVWFKNPFFSRLYQTIKNSMN